MRRFVPALGVLALLLGLSSVSCLKGSRSTWPNPALAPTPDSPVAAVRLLEWAWNHENCGVVQGLLTDDFQFVFHPGDSAGNAYRDVPWGREDEIAASCHLFSEARSIRLSFDRDLVDLPDNRPGKNPGFHRLIHTGVRVIAVIPGSSGDQVHEVTGSAAFYAVRGDSAVLPPDLVARGFGPDPGRWYLERCEDATLPNGLRSNAVARESWGALKAAFR